MVVWSMRRYYYDVGGPRSSRGRLFISNLNEVAFFMYILIIYYFCFFKEFIDLVSLEKVKVPGGIDNHDRY